MTIITYFRWSSNLGEVMVIRGVSKLGVFDALGDGL